MTDAWANAVVSRIALAIYVPPEGGKTVHTNRPFHGFVLNSDTSMKDYIFSDGRVLHTCEYDFFYLPKGSSYRVKSISGSGCWAINFDADVQDEPFVMHFRNHEPLVKIFRTAARDWRAQNGLQQPAVRRAVYDLICQMLAERQRPYAPNSRREIIAPAMAKLGADFTENELTVGTLSSLCGISEAYFRRIFSSEYGMSPREYLISLRIGYARQLLESGQFPVSEVARLCGYSEPSHFTREFTRRVGVSPGQYRKVQI